jgi:20S proteasome alpha/beta subunit
MCSTYITELIKCFGEHGYLEKKSEVASGGTFLVGYKGVLYRVDNDFQVGISHDPYDACGCGEYYALGALDVLTTFDTDSEEDARNVVVLALKAAERYSAGVRRPFTVEVLG